MVCVYCSRRAQLAGAVPLLASEGLGVYTCSKVIVSAISWQANVDKNQEQAEWKLDALAEKMVQYCYLLEGLTGE